MNANSISSGRRAALGAWLTACAMGGGLLFVLAPPSRAQQPEDTRQQIERLQQQVMAIQRESQRELEALQQRTDSRLQALQEQITKLSLQVQDGETVAVVAGNDDTAASSRTASPMDKLTMTGDFRLRYEANSSDGATPSWDRGVLRGRLGARYRLDDSLDLGARLVTGDADNPRTADTTIGDFDGDLNISLDQAFVAYRNGGLLLTGGKFAKTFRSTELVWDGDVNPQGVGGHYDFAQNGRWSARASAVYFLIDENIFEGDSDMLGAQISATMRPHGDWTFALHGAYFDYDIGTLNPGAPGRARGNNLAPGGAALLSDFELLDVIGTATYSGFGDRWNIRFVGDYVRNLGAIVPEDTGYGFDIFAGKLDRPGNLVIRYGFSQAETDAVLGMFSNDNITYATNYKLHTLSVDYALRDHTFVGLTNYRYRHLDPLPGPSSENDWVSRTRLNLYFAF